MDPTYAITAHQVSNERPMTKENVDSFYEDNACELLLGARRSLKRLADLPKAIVTRLRASDPSANLVRKAYNART